MSLCKKKRGREGASTCTTVDTSFIFLCQMAVLKKVQGWELKTLSALLSFEQVYMHLYDLLRRWSSTTFHNPSTTRRLPSQPLCHFFFLNSATLMACWSTSLKWHTPLPSIPRHCTGNGCCRNTIMGMAAMMGRGNYHMYKHTLERKNTQRES